MTDILALWYNTTNTEYKMAQRDKSTGPFEAIVNEEATVTERNAHDDTIEFWRTRKNPHSGIVGDLTGIAKRANRPLTPQPSRTRRGPVKVTGIPVTYGWMGGTQETYSIVRLTKPWITVKDEDTGHTFVDQGGNIAERLMMVLLGPDAEYGHWSVIDADHAQTDL